MMAHASAHVQRDLRALWRKRRQTPQCRSLQRLRIGARRSDRSGGRSPDISCRRCWPLRSTGSMSRWRPPPLTRSWMPFFVIRGSNAAATSAYFRSRRFATRHRQVTCRDCSDVPRPSAAWHRKSEPYLPTPARRGVRLRLWLDDAADSGTDRRACRPYWQALRASSGP
jgi:hypothetical protein